MISTDNIILELPGSMESEAVTTQEVSTYVETPAPTPDNVPVSLVQTLPASNVAPRNAVDDFVAGLESIWNSAGPILQTVGVIPTPGQNTAPVKSPAQIAAENQAAQSRQLAMIAGVGVLVYLLTR